MEAISIRFNISNPVQQALEIVQRERDIADEIAASVLSVESSAHSLVRLACLEGRLYTCGGVFEFLSSRVQISDDSREAARIFKAFHVELFSRRDLYLMVLQIRSHIEPSVESERECLATLNAMGRRWRTLKNSASYATVTFV
mmetsp:Transcript_48885/g.81350  ORF Transcript_48885/g.81350 Transcript_48885/m.81350 type:complete len:143 (+) Transcript_48885:104-532(+)